MINDMNETTEHLKMIQGVINRMAQTSFILKGWSLTIVIAILGFASNLSNGQFGLLALFPAFLFWGLDAYYLHQERLFRCLYEKVRLDPSGAEIPSFSMDTTPCKYKDNSWWRTLVRPTIGLFHFVVVILILVVATLIIINGGGNIKPSS